MQLAHPCNLCVFPRIQVSLSIPVRGASPSCRLICLLTLALAPDLLDQDSEMQRAFGELDSFNEPATHLQQHRAYALF